jgi:hypothetical protein
MLLAERNNNVVSASLRESSGMARNLDPLDVLLEYDVVALLLISLSGRCLQCFDMVWYVRSVRTEKCACNSPKSIGTSISRRIRWEVYVILVIGILVSPVAK